MVQLNHLSLALPDVAEASAFMQKYFGFKQLELKGDQIAVLEGEGGFLLVLTTKRKEDPPYPADFHFGFVQREKEEIMRLYRQLIADGYNIPRTPAKIRNTFAFYFHMPGGIMVEISCNLPSEK